MRKRWLTLIMVLLLAMNIGVTSMADEIDTDEEKKEEVSIPVEISGEESGYFIELIKDSFVYTGEEIKLEDSEFEILYKVTENENIVIDKNKFIVTYENNVDVTSEEHKAKIVVTGNGIDYVGSIQAEFEILPKNIETVKVSLSRTSFVYSGKAIMPEVVVKDGEKTLVCDQDYKVEYKNNLNIGTGNVQITGINNYSGTIKKSFTIKALDGSTTVTTTSSNKGIKVSWKKQEYASGYQVYRSTSQNGTYTKIATISNGKTYSYQDSKVTMGKTYYYKVRSYRVINGKTYTGSFSAVKKQKAQIAKVTGVDAVGYTYNAVKVTWSKVGGATGYVVYRSTSEKSGYKVIKTVTGNSTLTYTDRSVECGRKYYYKVRAYQTVGKTKQYGDASAADVGHPKPLRTTITSNSISSSTSALLKWKKSSGAKGYVIYRNDGSGYKLVKRITNANTLSWKDTGLKSTKEYLYKIKSYTVVDKKYVYSTSYSNVYKRSKAGWRYVNGYKLYYNNNGEIVQDVRNLIGKQSSYVIKVNKQQCITTVYAKDGENGYIIPVVAFVCSPGKGTPTGTFYTPAKYRWHELYGNVYGQWDTRINGHVLFHSVYYTSVNNKNTLSVNAYNKLGTQDSMGCIRLTAGDAKWVYDNCALKTKVVIYNSSKAEPLKKPSAYKLPSWHTWDPTDPTANSKCKSKGCH